MQLLGSLSSLLAAAKRLATRALGSSGRKGRDVYWLWISGKDVPKKHATVLQTSRKNYSKFLWLVSAWLIHAVGAVGLISPLRLQHTKVGKE